MITSIEDKKIGADGKHYREEMEEKIDNQMVESSREESSLILD